MSIYCSYFSVGEEHDDKCKRLKKVRGGFTQDDSEPCTCGSCPIEYRGSHILPTEKDGRDGQVGISAIPDHITNPELDFRPWKPFLRVHLNDETVVITRKQAQEFHRALGDWIDESKSANERG